MSELSNDTLKIGISLAILCHCFGLMFLTAPAPSEEDFPMTVIVKLDSAQAAVSEQGQSLGMESVSENSLTEKKVADKKREIYLGNKQLDRAGLTAVRACSGFVKRPPSTGVQPMNIYQEVRYQYRLR